MFGILPQLAIINEVYSLCVCAHAGEHVNVNFSASFIQFKCFKVLILKSSAFFDSVSNSFHLISLGVFMIKSTKAVFYFLIFNFISNF